MCRLFGFRSVITSQVHSSLLSAENALALQSSDHPDGWGVAYFLRDIPHVIKSAKAALNDSIFKRVSAVVSSHTVLAHIRKTTVGNNNILNTHPFQYGHWVFAHNGHIVDFDNKKAELKKHIAPELASNILGETDSEYIFYYLLSEMDKDHCLSEKNLKAADLVETIQKAIHKLETIVGAASKISDAGTDVNYFTFILTNGSVMLGHQGGKDLNFSTYKSKCHERDTCSSFNQSCENKVQNGTVNHLILSSEPLSGENIWETLAFGETVAVDTAMRFFKK